MYSAQRERGIHRTVDICKGSILGEVQSVERVEGDSRESRVVDGLALALG